MKFLMRDGESIPALGLGTWQLTGADSERTVRTALDLGYRHIDTARMYGNEAEVGRAVAASGVEREQVFLTTKVWMDHLTYGALQRSAEQSLKALNTPYVDLLLVHWPNPAVPLAGTLRALAELKAAGRARQVGVCNFPVALLRQAVEELGADLFCNQVEYHPLLSQRAVLSWLRAHGMLLTAYSPLAQGAAARHPVVTGIAARIGRTPAQVVLAWLLGQEGVAAIPKASGEAHLRANLEAADLRLDDADRAALDALQGGHRTVDPGFAPDWDR